MMTLGNEILHFSPSVPVLYSVTSNLPSPQTENGEGLVSEGNTPGGYVSHISVEDTDAGNNGAVELKVRFPMLNYCRI